MNKVELIGRLAKDVDLRATSSGKSVAQLTLAVKRNFKNEKGEYDADFINCIVWGKPADIISQYTTKGSQISVVGSLRVRSYDAQDGTKRYVTEVIVEEFNFLSSNKKESQDVQQDSAFVDEFEITDDDLPF